MQRTFWIFVAACALSVLGTAAIGGPPAPGASADPKPLGDTPIVLKKQSDWQARSMAWFKSAPDDKKGQRKEMRQATRALRKACKHCHSTDFKRYKDNRLISQQMMALSAEHDVKCGDCHSGRETLTEMGEASVAMFELSRKKQVSCEHCHPIGKRFETLNVEGKAQKKAWEAARKGKKEK